MSKSIFMLNLRKGVERGKKMGYNGIRQARRMSCNLHQVTKTLFGYKRSNMIHTDTVAAISTPYGKGGIAVVRLSGDRAFEIAGRIFYPKNGKKISDLPSKTAVYGDIYKDGVVIDDGIATIFRAPGSFTGEDTVEISCHGGVLLTARVYESLLSAGAAPAGPGEFSKRAFMNGKLSLSGAEAVIDLINAENDSQIALAGKANRTLLSGETEQIYADLTALLAQIYVFIDYPDEELSDLSAKDFMAALQEICARLCRLKESYKMGHAVMEGIPTAIVGKPNTGKSSILNALLGRERAIVSPIAGTTRDTVEETTTVGKILLRLSDTAGIHETKDTVEKMGVERSIKKINDAELILAVFDGSRAADEEDMHLIELLKDCSVPIVALLNKSDLETLFDCSILKELPTLKISAASGKMPDEFKELLEKLFVGGQIDYRDRAVLTSARQANATGQAIESIEHAIAALRSGFSPDIAALDVELAMSQIAAIDGRAVDEDIVSAIFSRFCVGK